MKYEVRGNRVLSKSNDKNSKWTGPDGREYDNINDAWDAYNE
jgi:hypothetical protein